MRSTTYLLPRLWRVFIHRHQRLSTGHSSIDKRLQSAIGECDAMLPGQQTPDRFPLVFDLLLERGILGQQVEYRPIKEPTWKSSSKERMVDNLVRIVVKPFADVPITKLDEFRLQMHLNSLADQGASKSVCQKFRVYMSAMLEEAVDQDLLSKNPARKLVVPKTREVRYFIGFFQPMK